MKKKSLFFVAVLFILTNAFCQVAGTEGSDDWRAPIIEDSSPPPPPEPVESCPWWHLFC